MPKPKLLPYPKLVPHYSNEEEENEYEDEYQDYFRELVRNPRKALKNPPRGPLVWTDNDENDNDENR